MSIDYDTFRTMPWSERITLFNAISAAERAELVRTHILRWADTHRQDLTPAQMELIHEWLAFIKPELYSLPRSQDSDARLTALEVRTAALFSREQMREALTMHWDQPGNPKQQ